MISNVSGATSSTAGSSKSPLSMKPEDFLSIMIKELQQQDPFNPTSSKDLIDQVGQVSNIQSSMELTKTLRDLSTSQKLTSASNMLGKVVLGKTKDGDNVSGLVTAVSKEGDDVYLELDSGEKLPINNVTDVYSHVTKIQPEA